MPDVTTVVLTGATTGIGEVAAAQLAPRVPRLFVHGPQPETAVAGLLSSLRAQSPGEVHYLSADFDELSEVEGLAADIAKHTGSVDVLINNAGRPGPRRRSLSGDGNETTLQTNYLAAVLLTARLMPLLQPGGGRVVHVSSATHLSASLDPDDLNLEGSEYEPTAAYARSKLALVAHALWLAEQAPEPRSDSVSLHPGVIGTSLLHAMFDIQGGPAKDGARNVVNAALSDSPWRGRYLDEDRPAAPNPAVLDPAYRSRLIGATFALLGRPGRTA